MNLQEVMMNDASESQKVSVLRIIWISLAGFGILFLIAFIFGFLEGHRASGGGDFSGKAIALLTTAGLSILGLGYVIWNQWKKLRLNSDHATPREKFNRNIILVCLGFGVLSAVAMALLSPDTITNVDSISNMSMFTNSKIPAIAALLIAAFWGIIMPIIAYYWHKKAIDEQEAAAYRDGGYYAAYAYIIGAPTWWILARGGILPEINGFVIFMAFNLIWCGVWFYKKYI